MKINEPVSLKQNILKWTFAFTLHLVLNLRTARLQILELYENKSNGHFLNIFQQ